MLEVFINLSQIPNSLTYSKKKEESLDGKCSMIEMATQEDSEFWNLIDLEMPGKQSKNGIILLIWDINYALNIKGISGEELTGTENYSMLIIEWKEIIEMWLIEIGDSTMERTVTRMELEIWRVMLIGIGIDIITIIEYNSIISGL